MIIKKIGRGRECSRAKKDRGCAHRKHEREGELSKEGRERGAPKRREKGGGCALERRKREGGVTEKKKESGKSLPRMHHLDTYITLI